MGKKWCFNFFGCWLRILNPSRDFVEDQSGPRNVKKNNFIHPSIEGPIAIFVGVIDIISKGLSYP